MVQLDSSEYPIVERLFAALNETQPMSAAVLAGVYPGRVYVDESVSPHSALLLTSIESEANGMWAFLAGDPTHAGFNQAINTALLQRQIVSNQVPMLFWTCDPGDWGNQLITVFNPLTPIWFPRHHYISRQANYEWRGAIPAGFEVKAMDVELLQYAGMVLPPDVAATLAKWRRLVEEGYAERGYCDFGCVTLDVRGAIPIVSSWATVDFIVDQKGDLGFFTLPEYRRKGLGTVAAAAVLEEGFRRGLLQVNWTCDADNQGSVQTANNLGFERIADYQMAFMLLDECPPPFHA